MKPKGLLAAATCLARKDLRELSRDGVGLALTFALPLALVAVFGFIMGRVGGDGGGEVAPRVDLALLDQDDSEASRALVAALEASPTLDVRRAGDEPWDVTDVRERVADGDHPYGLIIPPGYGDGGDLLLLRDPGRQMEEQIVMFSLVGAIFASRGEDAAWEMSKRGLAQSGLPPEWTERIDAAVTGFRIAVERMFEDAEASGRFEPPEPFASLGADGAGDGAGAGGAGADPDAGSGGADGVGDGPDMGDFLSLLLPLDVIDIEPEGRDAQIGYQVTHAVSGMTVMMLLFSLVGFGRSLLIERDKGTLVRLLTSPVPAYSVLLGKLLATFVVGMALVFVLFAFTHVVFDVDMLGRWDTLLVLSTVNCLACTAFAAAIAAWARSGKQADGVSVLVILMMSALGGSWFPTMLMPPAAQAVGRFTLTYWALSGYQGTFWYGKHWTDPDMLASMGVVAAVGVVLLALSVRLFRTRYLRT